MRPARISITGKLCKKLESIDAKILIPNERFLLRFPRCKSKDLETTFYIIVSFEKFKTSVIFLHAFIGHTIKLRYYFCHYCRPLKILVHQIFLVWSIQLKADFYSHILCRIQCKILMNILLCFLGTEKGVSLAPVNRLR